MTINEPAPEENISPASESPVADTRASKSNLSPRSQESVDSINGSDAQPAASPAPTTRQKEAADKPQAPINTPKQSQPAVSSDHKATEGQDEVPNTGRSSQRIGPVLPALNWRYGVWPRRSLPKDMSCFQRRRVTGIADLELMNSLRTTSGRSLAVVTSSISSSKS